MLWHAFDKGGKWLLQHHGDGALFLGGVRRVVRWRAVESELVQPGQLPDGLLEVEIEDLPRAVYFLLEIAAKAERRLTEQLVRDLLMVYLERGEVPEVLTLVLRRRGRYRVPPGVELASRLGLGKLTVSWRVVELWALSAEELLAANDVGLIPWVPLTHFDGPPEQLLRMCRERIDRQAPPEERANLLAVTQVMTQLVYNDPGLLTILGGSQIMLESPLIQEIVTKAATQAKHEAILSFLEERFGSIPPDLVAAVQDIGVKSQLDKLVKLAAKCPDLESFRGRLRSVAGRRGRARK